MIDTIIPVTYPGIGSYSLVFRHQGGMLQVQRSQDESQWIDVVDVRGTPHDKDPDQMLVEINGNMTHGTLATIRRALRHSALTRRSPFRLSRNRRQTIADRIATPIPSGHARPGRCCWRIC